MNVCESRLSLLKTTDVGHFPLTKCLYSWYSQYVPQYDPRATRSGMEISKNHNILYCQLYLFCPNAHPHGFNKSIKLQNVFSEHIRKAWQMNQEWDSQIYLSYSKHLPLCFPSIDHFCPFPNWRQTHYLGKWNLFTYMYNKILVWISGTKCLILGTGMCRSDQFRKCQIRGNRYKSSDTTLPSHVAYAMRWKHAMNK